MNKEPEKKQNETPQIYYDPHYLDGADDIEAWEKHKEQEWNKKFQRTEIYRIYNQDRSGI